MSAAPWRVALATAIGTSHERSGAPCQDSAALCDIETVSGLVLIAVVSDGAGSAACSDAGSSLAVRTFIDLVRRYFDGGAPLADLSREEAQRWVRETAETVNSTAELNGHLSRDYACTLLAAIVGDAEAAFVQVGDGAIVVSHGEDDGWAYVFWPQHGEYANTTNFIQSPELDEVLAFDLVPREITEFAMFSDGIETLVLNNADRTVHEPFFQRMVQPVRQSAASGLDAQLSEGLQRYLSSPVICERTDDDKTLVLATRAVSAVQTK